MITDSFENAKMYYSLNKYFEIAFDYIKNTDFMNLKTGRYEIQGDILYANVDEYITKTSSKPEYHKNYIDIQFLVKGTEKIGYCPLKSLKIDEKYSEEKDLGFGTGDVDYVKMSEGKFMIFFPTDAHQPCMALNEPESVKKVVVKVKTADE